MKEIILPYTPRTNSSAPNESKVRFHGVKAPTPHENLNRRQHQDITVLEIKMQHFSANKRTVLLQSLVRVLRNFKVSTYTKMVSQPIMNSIQKAAAQNIGLGLKGTLHRTHYSAPSGAGYHQHHHVYHMPDSGYGHGHSGHSEHGGGGSKKRSIALSALTLLAFLFFLNILQNCIEEQMDNGNNQQFIIMTSRLQQFKEGQEAIADAKSVAADPNTGDTKNIKRNFQKIQSQRKADHFSNSDSYPNTTVKIITKSNKIGRP